MDGACETLDVCLQAHCEQVEYTDGTQQGVGIALAIGGFVLLAGGVVMAVVGDDEVQVEPASDEDPGADTAWTKAVPELILQPTGAAARWRF